MRSFIELRLDPCHIIADICAGEVDEMLKQHLAGTGIEVLELEPGQTAE